MFLWKLIGLTLLLFCHPENFFKHTPKTYKYVYAQSNAITFDVP